MTTVGFLQKLAGRLAPVIYRDLARPMAQKLGIALGNLSGLLLFPVSEVPAYLTERGRLILKRNLDRFAKSLEATHLDVIRPIAPEIAVPIVQRLSYVQDEEISAMFINLLKTAADTTKQGNAHPSFVQCISSMTGDEARMMLLLSEEMVLPYVKVRCIFNANEGLDKTDMLTYIEDRIDFLSPGNISLYIANLSGLGILSKEIGYLSNTERYYQPLFQKYEGLRQALQQEGHGGRQYEMAFLKGYCSVTAYGRRFIEACIKDISLDSIKVVKEAL